MSSISSIQSPRHTKNAFSFYLEEDSSFNQKKIAACFEKFQESLASICTESPQKWGPIDFVKISLSSRKKELFLKKEIMGQIFDGQGMIKRKYTQSAHLVCDAKIEGLHFHFKQEPAHPLMEFAIHNLTSKIAQAVTPETDLSRFEVHMGRTVKFYPVLISETIEGKSLDKISGQSEMGKEAWDQWSWMFLSSALTKPGDGLASNYVVTQDFKIYCIDNDISLVDPINRSWLSTNVNFCSVLFCSPHAKIPLSKGVLEQFCNLDPYLLLKSWLEDILIKESDYLSLFSEMEQKILYSRDKNNTFKATILFRKGAATTLLMQFWHLQNFLKERVLRNQPVIGLDLLSCIINLTESKKLAESSENVVFQKYAKSHQQNISISDRLKNVISRNSQQSLLSPKSDQAAFGAIPSFNEVAQRDLYSPENALQELVCSILSKESRVVQLTRKENTAELTANFASSPQQEKWIFKSLEFYLNQTKVQITALKLVHSSLLNSETLNFFLNENLLSLEIGFCEQIDDGCVALIQKKCPHLSELSINGCPKLISFAQTKASLPLLDFTSLKKLSLKECTNLTLVKFKSGQLQALELERNKSLLRVEVESFPIYAIKFKGSSNLFQPLIAAFLKQHYPGPEASNFLSSLSYEILNTLDKEGITPLTRAASFNNKLCVQMLLNAGADVNLPEGDGWTPLMLASEHEDALPTLELLLNNGADINHISKDEKTALSIAVDRNFAKTVAFFIKSCPHIKIGEESLFEAVKSSSSEIVKTLLETGMDPNIVDADQNSPLHIAAAENDALITKDLLQKGANLSALDANGKTPFDCALQASSSKAMREILILDPTQTLKETNGLLTKFVKGGPLELLSTFLEAGASTEQADEDLRTPLFWAVLHQKEGAVALLLKHKANIHCMDREGETILRWAKRIENKNIEMMLLSHQMENVHL